MWNIKTKYWSNRTFWICILLNRFQQLSFVFAHSFSLQQPAVWFLHACDQTFCYWQQESQMHHLIRLTWCWTQQYWSVHSSSQLSTHMLEQLQVSLVPLEHSSAFIHFQHLRFWPKRKQRLIIQNWCKLWELIISRWAHQNQRERDKVSMTQKA